MISYCDPSPPGRERSTKGVSGLSWTAVRTLSGRIARVKLNTGLRSGETAVAPSAGSIDDSAGAFSVVKCQTWSSVFR